MCCLIRVTSAPDQIAPAEHREKWIGLVLEANDPRLPAVSEMWGVRYTLGPLGYTVPWDRGLMALRAHSPEAAEWWESWWTRVSPGCDPPKFTFGRDTCEVLEARQAIPGE